MDPIGSEEGATLCLQGIFELRLNEARYFCHHLNLDLCLSRYGEVFTQRDLMTGDVRIEMHFLVCAHVAGAP